MPLNDFCQKADKYIKNNTPFFFLIDFEKQKPVIYPLSECHNNGIYFQFNECRKNAIDKDIHIEAQPVSLPTYLKSFNIVKSGVNRGDSFLTNLTFPAPITCDSSLIEIYKASKALFKLYYKDQLVVFSPESFIQIRNNKIKTFPMKGTIMANHPDAVKDLLESKKEQWEHNTIVDLMRNDLSMVANNVEVNRFRYISEIMTYRGKMLQTSSEISGDLRDDWQDDFAQLLLKLLPAGSICGAPKDKTVAIIKEAEIDQRGYYTGVFGTYEKGNVDSAVAIRYIEKKENGQMQYRSGGGITFMSDGEDEYNEIINKIYVPTR